VLYSFALLAVSVLPPLFGLATFIYLAGAVLAGAALTIASFGFLASRTPVRARRLFMASNIYLIVMMTLLVLA
jgi:protoheme IX farnesyltransferase